MLLKLWQQPYHLKSKCVFGLNSSVQQPTNEDEGEADAEGQDITSERFIVFPITLCKETQPWIDVVLTQSLESHHHISLNSFQLLFVEKDLTSKF